MNKTELIAAVAAQSGSTKKAASLAVEALVETIQEELAKGEKVQIIGFGTFESRVRKARQGRNPKTGEGLEIPAAQHPFFSVGKELKTVVNEAK